MKRVEQIHRLSAKIIQVSGLFFLSLCALFIIEEILFNKVSFLADYELLPWVISLYKWMFGFSIGICFAFLAIQSICEHFGVKSEAEIEEENRIRYVIEQYDNHKKTEASPNELPEDYNPFRQLTDQQQNIIIGIIAQLPSHPKKPNEIKLDMLALYLTALNQLNYLDIMDKANLRLWAAQITGKNMPDSSHFNAAIPKKDSKRLDEAIALINNALA